MNNVLEKQNELKNVSIDKLIPDKAGLRTTVDKKHEKWPELVASIRHYGVQSPISVRPHPDPEGSGYAYIVIDGFHRLTAVQEIYQTDVEQAEAEGDTPPLPYTIPVMVLNVETDTEVYIRQITANEQTIKTKPTQLRDHLLAIMSMAYDEGKEITQADLARKLDVSNAWISNILKLRNLDDSLKEKVDSGAITASNAFNLAKLDKEDQLDFADRAESTNAADFNHLIGDWISKRKQAERENRPKANEFTLTTRLWKKGEVEELHNTLKDQLESADPDMLEAAKERVDEDNLDFILGQFYAAQRILTITEEDQRKQREEWDAQQAERARKRQTKMAEDAAESAADKGVNVLGGSPAPLPIATR
jgi:ParB-like chromosome segregation protein Spo0J